MRPHSSELVTGLAVLALISTSAFAGDPALLAQTARPGGAAPAVKSIATAEGETPDMRAEIIELKRTSGDQLMLRFMIVNESSKPFNFSDRLADPALSGKDHSSVGGVHLIDTTNKKKHFVLRDSEGNCVCSRKLGDIAAQGRMNLWARFPAPPVATQKISIVIPRFVPVDDVPITR
jgi:hypothetical protein